MKVKSLQALASEIVCKAEPRLQPHISYENALASRFTMNKITYKVGACPNPVFKSFIEGCCRQAPYKGRSWNSAQQEKLLSMLEKDESSVARWYVIDMLLACKVAVPLER